MSAPYKPGDPVGGSEAAHEVLEEATGGLDPRGTGGGVAVAPGDTDDPQDHPGPRTVPPITDRARLEARQIIGRYPRERSALLPMLHLVQSEQGYITPAGIAFCAEELGLTKAEVAAVATFYTMYKRRPTGEYLVSVCTNTLCGFLGGEEIYHALSDYLGVGHDQTTTDGLITLEHAECLAACDYAPVVTVNYEFYDQQDTGTAMNIVTDLQQGGRPVPTRGAPLVSFREISRELAGFGEPAATAVAVAGPSAGEPTIVGNRVALRLGHEAPVFDPHFPIGAAAAPADGGGAPGASSSTPAPVPSSTSAPVPNPAAAASTNGATATKTSAERATAVATGPAETAGAVMADPDADQATKQKSVPDGAAADTEPPASARPDADRTGAATGPADAPPAARRTRNRTRTTGARPPTDRKS